MSPDATTVARTDAGLAAELRASVGRLARRLRTERESAAELGIGAMSVLGFLYREGDLTVGQLADRERVRPPSMTRTVGFLEAAGHVARNPCEEDRRQVIVTLTDHGKATLLADRRRREAWLARRLSELTRDERATLRAALPVLERLSLT